MVQSIEWFKREFSFDLPVWMYPNVIERLRGTPARAEEMVRPLGPESLTRREGERWSIQEQVGHLLDLSSLDLSRLDDFEAGRESLSAADLKNRKTYEADHNSQPIDSLLASFRAARAEFVRRLEGYDAAFIERMALHPRLQMRMRVLDFAFFMAEHDDHHLARISELIRAHGG